jgi:hypothetical protein
MDRLDNWWDGAWAGLWLRRLWGLDGPLAAEGPQAPSAAPACDLACDADAEAEAEADTPPDIAGWPALVAPFYD